MLPWSRLASERRARRHVVNELVVLIRQPMLLALAVERDLGPFGRTIGIAEGAGPVLLGLCRCDALGVTNGARVLDLGENLLLIVLGQTAVLDVIGKRVKALVIGLEQTRDSAQSREGFAPAVRCQQADRLGQRDGELARQRQGSSPAPTVRVLHRWRCPPDIPRRIRAIVIDAILR